MTERVKVVPVSRANLDPLVEMAEHLRGCLPGWEDTAPSDVRPRRDSDLALDLAHLAHHDGDGFLIATVADTVGGFCTAFVRSRTLFLTGLWVLPEFQEGAVAGQLVRRALSYGDRAGAAETCALFFGDAPLQGLLFRFGLRPRCPVYRLQLAVQPARALGGELARLLPGGNATEDSICRRSGRADTERIDRLTRGVARPMDHEYWLTGRQLGVAMVRDGNRIAAYAYGGGGHAGPLAATTSDGALAALGWALQLAAEGAGEEVELLIPAVFEAGVEQLLESGAQCRAAGQWLSRNPSTGLERCLLASTTLP